MTTNNAKPVNKTPANDRHLLKTKIKDLTPEILAALEQPLGTSTHPYPMWGTQRVDDGNGGANPEQFLSVIADDAYPMKVYSERPYEEVVALAICDMPVPSMLPLFKEALERRAPTSTNRTQFLIGDPGAGKSFMGAMQGRLRSKERVEVFDCGGKSMNDLLFEMVLDFGTGDGLPVAIDKRLKAGTLNTLSILKLKQLDDATQSKIDKAKARLAGQAVRLTADEEETARNAVASLTESLKDTHAPAEAAELQHALDNFNRRLAGEAETLDAADREKIGKEIEAYNAMRVLSFDGDKIVSIDWTALEKGGNVGNDTVTAALEILKEVSSLEGLDKGGGNALGMNSQFGPLIKAFIEGREIVLDEYNKSKEGSDNALQTVWQFMIGELDSCTVENPLKNKDLAAGPSSFTFKRDDMQLGFFVTLTGNKTEDGLTTRSLNKSVYSRLSPKTLPDPTAADWGHRIAQMMVGMPVLTIYNAFRPNADAHPKEFGDWMMEQRRIKARIEGTPIPALQETLLQNWQNIVTASEKLAKFYSTWAEMTDVDAVALKHSDLMEEVDEEYSKVEGIDFRKIKQHLEEAIPIRPKMVPKGTPLTIDFTNYNKKPDISQAEPEDPAVGFGTRLVDFLDNLVYEKTKAVGKKELYKKLLAEMDDWRKVKLLDAAYSGQKSLEQSLNISVYDSDDMSKQAKAARKVYCDYLREVEPEIKGTDEQIITVNRLKKALQAVADQNTAETQELFIVNRDHATLIDQPFASAHIDDEMTWPKGYDENDIDFALSDMVTHEDFLAALALPTVSAKNLDAIWDTNVRARCIADGEDVTETDLTLQVAENRSQHGIGVTTLQVLYDDAEEGMMNIPVHIVRRGDGKTLVVSEAAPQKLQRAFKEAGIAHVDRHSDNAAAKVESELNHLISGMPSEVSRLLRHAFKYRNVVKADDARSLAELLVDDQLQNNYGKFLLKGDARAFPVQQKKLAV